MQPTDVKYTSQMCVTNCMQVKVLDAVFPCFQLFYHEYYEITVLLSISHILPGVLNLHAFV